MQRAAFVVFASNPRRVRRAFDKEWLLLTALFLVIAFAVYVVVGH